MKKFLCLLMLSQLISGVQTVYAADDFLLGTYFGCYSPDYNECLKTKKCMGNILHLKENHTGSESAGAGGRVSSDFTWKQVGDVITTTYINTDKKRDSIYPKGAKGKISWLAPGVILLTVKGEGEIFIHKSICHP